MKRNANTGNHIPQHVESLKFKKKIASFELRMPATTGRDHIIKLQ